MQTLSPADIAHYVAKYTELALRVATDSQLQADLARDPVATFRKMGFAVESEMEATAVELARILLGGQSLINMEAPTTLSRSMASEPSVQVGTNWAGIVITLDSDAVRNLKVGTASGTGITAIIAAIAAVAGPAGVPVALISGILTAYFTLHASLLEILDKGNGVYLTIPWAAMAGVAMGPGFAGPALLAMVIPTSR